MEISTLITNNKGHDASKYRGIGTELVKQAVRESLKQGFEGRIALIAGNNSGEGRKAEGFYSHIGFNTPNPDNKSIFILPEKNISKFLED